MIVSTNVQPLTTDEYRAMLAQFEKAAIRRTSKARVRKFLRAVADKFNGVGNVLEYRKNLCVVILETYGPVIFAYGESSGVFYLLEQSSAQLREKYNNL